MSTEAIRRQKKWKNGRLCGVIREIMTRQDKILHNLWLIWDISLFGTTKVRSQNKRHQRNNIFDGLRESLSDKRAHNIEQRVL